MNNPANLFVRAVIDSRMAGKFFAGFGVKPAFIGMQGRLTAGIGNKDFADGVGVGIFRNVDKRDHLAKIVIRDDGEPLRDR